MLDSVINPLHLMMILAVVVVLFGPKRLPEMGQKIGQALREFKSATSEIRSQIGVDDIADSVKDIKSGLSLTTTDSPSSGGEMVSDLPAGGLPASAVGEAEPLGAAVQAAAVATAAPAVDQPLRDDSTSATGDGDEAGVEDFGSLKRGSAS